MLYSIRIAKNGKIISLKWYKIILMPSGFFSRLMGPNR